MLGLDAVAWRVWSGWRRASRYCACCCAQALCNQSLPLTYRDEDVGDSSTAKCRAHCGSIIRAVLLMSLGGCAGFLLTSRRLSETPRETPPCGTPWSHDCFDRSRCLGPDGITPHLTVYVHDDDCSGEPSATLITQDTEHKPSCSSACKHMRDAARRVASERQMLVQRAEDACVIVSVLDSARHQCVAQTSMWQEGRNHLLLDWSDQARGFHHDVDGKAMFASSNMHASYFRFGYDIALPLPAKKDLDQIRNVASTRRRYFATFKGQLYLHGEGQAEREAVRQFGLAANSSDVVVSESCQELHGEHLLEKNLEFCIRLKKASERYDYNDLMNSTFALIPAGRSPATHRLAEALSAGCIPVFVHDDFVKPFPDRIPWRKCSLSFPIEEAPGMMDALRAVTPSQLLSMQATAAQVYDENFKGGVEGITRITYDVLEERLAFRSER